MSARYIPGVSDHCDRWCERCRLADRCKQYAFELELGDLADPHETEADRDARFRAALENVYGIRGSDLAGDADESPTGWEPDEPDRDLDDLLTEPEPGPDDGPFERAYRHPLAAEGMNLAVDLTRWMRAHGADADEAVESLPPHPCGVTPADALAAVRWYGVQIGPKLSRACGQLSPRRDAGECPAFDTGAGWEDAEDAEVRGWREYDRDGSAKVALLAAERALGGWTVLRDALPHHDADAVAFQKRLARLRAAIDRVFPGARTFVRPGFDDGTLDP